MKIISPREYPYMFWSHVWGLIEMRNDFSIPGISGFLPGRDLTYLIWSRRGGTLQNANRTARLMLNRWEPGMLGERASRPGYRELYFIWETAAKAAGVFEITWWLEDENFIAEMTRLGGYRIPATAVLSSINPVSDEEKESERQFYRAIEQYRRAGATVLYTISPTTRRGQKYVLGCWLVWESREQKRINFENLSRMPGP